MNKPMIAALALALLLVGCSQPQQQSQLPTPAQNTGQVAAAFEPEEVNVAMEEIFAIESDLDTLSLDQEFAELDDGTFS